MPSLGTISLRITADMGQLLAGLNQIGAKITVVEKQAKQASIALKGLGAAFAVFKFFENVIGDSIEKAYEFVREAEGLGLTTEAFGKLKLAMLEVGGTTSELAGHLRRMEISLGEAQMTADHAQRTFRGHLGLLNDTAKAYARLGLNAKELVDLPVDKQFERISEAILRIPDTAEQFIALQDAFRNIGRGEATRLLALMRKIRDEGDEIARRAKNLGFFVRPEDIEGIKRGRAALADLGAVWEGVQIQLGTKFAPVLAESVERLMDWLDEQGGAAKAVDGMANRFRDMVGSAEQIGDTLISAFIELSTIWNKIVIGYARMMSNMPGSGMFGNKFVDAEIEAQEAIARNTVLDANIRQRAFNRTRKRLPVGFKPGPVGVNLGLEFGPPSEAMMKRWQEVEDRFNRVGNAADRMANRKIIQVWQDQAKLIHQEVLPAYSQFLFMLDQINKAQNLGGLSEADTALATLKAFRQAEQGLYQTGLPQTLHAGSVAEASFRAQFENQPSQDVQVRIATTLARMEQHESVTRQAAEAVLAALRKQVKVDGGSTVWP